MRTLPLYRETPLAPVEVGEVLDCTSECDRCNLSVGRKTVCIKPFGEPGGLLVVADKLTQKEEDYGKPWWSPTYKWLQGHIRKRWKGPIVVDTAVRCWAGSREVTSKHVEACRPYLSQTIEEVSPTRIFVFGQTALESVVGVGSSIMSMRRGYGWTSEKVPIFYFTSPVAAAQNKFLKARFLEDLDWALEVDDRTLRMDIPWRNVARFVETPEDAHQAVEEIRTWLLVTLDGEWAGDRFTKDFDLLTLAFCGPDSNDPWVWDKEALRDPDLNRELKVMLADPNVPKCGHNIRADMLSIRCGLGIAVKGVVVDTVVERKAVDSDGEAGLDVLQHLLGMGGAKDELEVAKKAKIKLAQKRDTKKRSITQGDLEAIAGSENLKHVMAIREKRGKPDSYAFALVDSEIRDPYCARDVLSTSRLHYLLEPQVPDPTKVVLRDLVYPAVEAFEQIEAWGVAVDLDKARTFKAFVQVALEDVMKGLLGYAEINWGSVQQLSEFLFGELKLEPQGYTASGAPSTDTESLEPMKDQHPAVALVLEKRRLEKQQDYADLVLDWVRDDGRIHPVFRLTGTRTGRISVAEPQLHQIPRKDSAEGKMARDCYVASPGYKLVSLDQNQVELRIASDVSQDPNMIGIFDRGEDYHLATARLIAKEVWGKDPLTITKESPERSRAKAVNFGLLFGMGPKGLARNINCTVAEAEVLMEAVLGAFESYKRWGKLQVMEARREGYIWTRWKGQRGRRRDLWRIADNDGLARSRAEHGCTNTPIQGEASDVSLDGTVKIVKWILQHNIPAKVVLTVHDSVIAEVREDWVDRYIVEASRLMTSYPTRVKLIVDAEVGLSWGSLAKYKRPEAPG